jgi:hypothetical protein
LLSSCEIVQTHASLLTYEESENPGPGGVKQHMDPFRIDVVQRGKSFVAVSQTPVLTGLGASAEEAVEAARRMALAYFARGPRPTTLIVRVKEPGVSTIVMQPLELTFSLAADAEQSEWRYKASVNIADRAPGIAELGAAE